MKSLPILFLLLVCIVTGCSKSTSLSDCPDCGQTVSVRASECPHCGAPVEFINEGNIRNKGLVLREDPDGEVLSITLKYDKIYTKEMQEISSLPKLMRLTIFGRALKTTLNPLENMESLLDVALFECDLSQSDFMALSKIPNLRELKLYDCKFLAHNTIESLITCKELRFLSISNPSSKIELRTLRALSAIPNLETLDLEECQLPYGFDAELFRSGFLDLYGLWIKDCNVSLEDVEKILADREANGLNHFSGYFNMQHYGKFRPGGDASVSDLLRQAEEGTQSWWIWCIALLVGSSLGVGWWRIKLRTKTSDSIEEQISDLNEESST